MELRNEKDARFIIRHHVTEEKLLHLEKGVRKLGFQSGGKRIMSIFLGLFLLCMAAKVVIGGTIGDALMMIGILCAMGFVFGTYALFERLAGREKADPSPVRGGEDGRQLSMGIPLLRGRI